MRGAIHIASLGFWLGLLSSVFGQAPPNDNFANRTVLTGNEIVFTGSLSGSTIEPGEPTNISFWPAFPITNSVWWTWTATESGPVTLVALSNSEDIYVPGYFDDTCALEVYAGTNIFGSPGATPLCDVWPNPAIYKPSVSFQAVAGTSYQFQFLGLTPTLTATFELIATNPPVILDPPTDQTVFPNGSALFTVLAAGIPGLTYQWKFNGVDLPGENGPMLALAYVTNGQAGAYSVLVSNATGAILAGPANLAINSNPIRPLLQAQGMAAPNAFAFSLAGESGRYYQIESSTNLSTWKIVTNFPISATLLSYPPQAVKYRSVVYNTNATISLTVSNGSGATFFRASLYFPFDETCEMHLKQIRFAKQLWARNFPVQSRDATPAMSDMQTYWSDISTATCPILVNAGYIGFEASYLVENMTTDPACQIDHRHVLNEPR